MQPRPLIILGIGSLARLAHYYATNEMGLHVCGFVVDARFKTAETFLGLPVLDWDTHLRRFPPQQVSMYVAVGYRSMRQREAAYARAVEEGYEMANIVSRAAFLAKDVAMGGNNFIMPGAVIEPGVAVGANNVVWSNATICHDATVGDHNFIASNVTIGGEVSIGSRNFLGFSAVVTQQRQVGDDVLIGAQSLLLGDAESLAHYQGVPAKKVRVIDPATGISLE